MLTDEFKQLQSELKLPHPLADEGDWQAEKAVKLCIAANPDLGTEPLMKAVEQCKSLLALEDAGEALGTKIDFAATKKKLVTLEKDLAKAEKAVQGDERCKEPGRGRHRAHAGRNLGQERQH